MRFDVLLVSIYVNFKFIIMNKDVKNPVIITEEDYQQLKGYINHDVGNDEEMTLSAELKRAVIISKEAFPPHAIRLNSKVLVQDLDTDIGIEFTIVMPAHADMQKNKVSILTPMGAALIGFRKGEEVRWKVSAGFKRFRILEVTN